MNRIFRMRSLAPQVVERSHLIQPLDRIETASRVLSGLLLVGAVFGGGALFLQAAPAHAERKIVHAPVALQAKSVKTIKPNSVVVAASSPRRIWIDPPPVTSAEQRK